jgi:hypothetical protein
MIYNIPTHIAGDTWPGIHSITISSTSNPVNLLSAAVFFELKSYYNHASPTILELSTANNSIVVVDSDTFSIPSIIVDIPVGSYRYSLKVVSNSTTKTYLQGKWNIVNYIDPRLVSTTSNTSTLDSALDVGDMQTMSVVLVQPDESIGDLTTFLAEYSGNWQRSSTNITLNSSAYFNYEEVEDLNTVQSLTSTFLNSASFTQNFSSIVINASLGIVDGGLF